MTLLNKAQILNADDIPTKDVPVPEWGGTVRVRGLRGDERDKYEQSCLRMSRKGRPEANLQNATARLCALTIVDENNSRLFITDDEVKELGKKSAAAIQRVFDAASELSGFTQGEVEELVESFS